MTQDVPFHATPDDAGVVAVLVSHDGAAFLPRTLAALAALDPAPDAVVAVDTGSEDASPALLHGSAVVDQVVRLPRETGFAAAVHAGVDSAPDSTWLWVLHDDSAPEPGALGVLLRHAEDQPSVAVWGPKVLGWDEPRRLLEVGVSITRSGRRFTGLERGEQDQGQYEGQREVLAVGSAGALVRRGVWSDLGGFDRVLRYFREDVDFGWRVNLAGHRVVVATDAVVHHAEAMARGRRAGAAGDAHAIDRVSALYTLLVNGRSTTLVLRWLWLLVQTLVRALGFVLGKAPREAAAETGAIAAVLLRPRRVLRARRARRRWRTVGARSLRSLFPPPGQQVRHTLESVAGTLTVEVDVSPSTVLESGPVEEDLDSFVSSGSGRLRRLVRRPGVLLFTAVLLGQLIAWRGLFQGGVLHGGALLPVPTGASDVWQAYTSAWHPVQLGSDTMAHPSTAVLALLATLLLGHATWVVPTLLVVGPALAGVLAYQVTRSFGLSQRLRLWLGAVYALNPVLLAATAQGRWTTVLVAVLLPLLAVAGARALGVASAEPSGRATAVAVLLTAVVLALSPALLLPLATLIVVAVVRARSARARRNALVLLLAPLLVLLPWWPAVVSDPTILLLEPGVPMTSDSEPAWQVLFLDPGGWWSAPWWFGAVFVVLVVAAVLRAQQVRAVRVGLAVTALALGWALVLEAVTVQPDVASGPVLPWSGSTLLVAVAAGLVTAAVAARGSRERARTAAFSWRQPALALVTALALLSPVVWGVTWLTRGAGDPIDRGTANPLPAFVRAQSALPEQIRTLVLQPVDGRLAYTVLRNRDAQWGDVETAPTVADLESFSTVVSDLASGRGSAPVDELATHAVQFVLAVAPVDPDLEVALDSAPGLLRIANPGESSLWRVEIPTGRIRVLADDVRTVVASEVPGDPAAARAELPAGATERMLELAELADDGWQGVETSDDGEVPLTPRTTGELQSFTVSAGAGTVTMQVEDAPRTWMLWVQLVLVLVAVVVALPGRSRVEEEVV
jgi:GT2 family glycosyltransferase